MRSRWIVAGLAAVLVAGGSSVYAANSHGKVVSTLAQTTTLEGQARGETVSDQASTPAARAVRSEAVSVQSTPTATACDTARAALAKLRQDDRAEDTAERQAAAAADTPEDQAEHATNRGEDEAENPADKAEDQAEKAADVTEDKAEHSALRAAQSAVKAACTEQETEVEGAETETDAATSDQPATAETDRNENASAGSGD